MNFKTLRYRGFVLTPTCLNIPLSTHLNFEMEISRGSKWELFDFSFTWPTKVDHAGPRFSFSIAGIFGFEAKVYDRRHWNHNEDRWFRPGEEASLRISE